MSFDKTSIPAVVVGAAGACGLGIVRSLSQANVPVILVDITPYAPAMHTRFARKVLVSQLAGPSLIRDLLALASTFSTPAVLFLTSDEAMLTVSQYRSELASKFRFTLPSHDCLTLLSQKRTFQDLAESLGFLVPRCVRIRSADNMDSLAELRFPAVVKPTTKTAAYVSAHFARGYKVDSAEEAKAKCRLILGAVPELVVQEWVDGADTDLYFCLLYRSADGSTLCSFAGRKISIWPPDVGLTASCTAAPEVGDALVSLTQAFFDQVSFVGIGGMEFKKDAQTGSFVMIEPTVGRVDAQEEVATIHGINIPLIAYLHEAGLPLPPVPANQALKVWQNSWSHWRALRGNTLQHFDTRGLTIVDAYWRVNDPMPAVIHCFGWSLKLLGTALSHRSKPNGVPYPTGTPTDSQIPVATRNSSFHIGRP
jgi:D-aspartate ligase